MKFERTGLFKLYIGGRGLSGDVLSPGSYYAGGYTDIIMVDCSMVTVREPLTALTKDGVQFGLDIYVRFAVECSDQSVRAVMTTVTPDEAQVISVKKFYSLFVKPEIGEAVRQVVSPYRANELNDRREELVAAIQKRVKEGLTTREKWISVYDVNLSNLDFPEAMDAANVERAVQSVMRDKSIAERERVLAEIETTRMRRELAEREGEAAAAKIDKIGAALARNPDFMQYDLQSKMPEIYREAGNRENMIITAPSPQIMVSPRTPSGARVITPIHDDAIGTGPASGKRNPLTPHENRPVPAVSFGGKKIKPSVTKPAKGAAAPGAPDKMSEEDYLKLAGVNMGKTKEAPGTLPGVSLEGKKIKPSVKNPAKGAAAPAAGTKGAAGTPVDMEKLRAATAEHSKYGGADPKGAAAPAVGTKRPIEYYLKMADK